MNDLDLFLPYGAETTYDILDSAIYSQYNQTNSSALFRIGGDMYQYQLLRVVYPNNTENTKPDEFGSQFQEYRRQRHNFQNRIPHQPSNTLMYRYRFEEGHILWHACTSFMVLWHALQVMVTFLMKKFKNFQEF
jgi:hypothetical protein